MSVKHLRGVAGAFAILGLAATSASAHPLEPIGHGAFQADRAAHVRPDDRAARLGVGQGSLPTDTQPAAAVASTGDRLDWTDAGLSAAIGLAGAGIVFTVGRRRIPVTG